MNAKLFFGAMLAVFLVGCGGSGSDNTTITNTEKPTSFEVGINIVLDEDTSSQIATTLEGEVKEANLSSLPKNGVAVLSADKSYVTYTPRENYYGSDDFSLEISTADGKQGVLNVSLRINSVNDPPIPNQDSVDVSYTQGDPMPDFVVSAYDPDGDEVYSYISSNLDGETGVVFIERGRLNININPDFIGSDSFEVSFSDGKAVVVVAVHIEVLPGSPPPPPLNNPPTISCVNYEMFVGGKEGIVQCNAYDPDGDVITYSISSAPAHGVASVRQNGAVSYTPNLDYVGSDSIVVKATDNEGLSDEAMIELQVMPKATLSCYPTTMDVEVGKSSPYPVSCRVVNRDTETYVFEVVSGGGGVINQDGILSFTATDNVVGDQVVVVVGATPLTDTVEVVFNIIASTSTPPNIWCPSDITVKQGEESIVQCDAYKPEGVIYSISSAPAYGVASVNQNGAVSYTPNLDYVGSDSIVVKATDNEGLSDETVVDFQVVPNQVPLLECENGGTVYSGEERLLSCVVTNSLPDDRPVFSIKSGPSFGLATIDENGVVSYTPNVDYVGMDAMSVNVTTSRGTSRDVSISFDVVKAPIGVVVSGGHINLPIDDLLIESSASGNVDILYVHCFENDCSTGRSMPYIVESYNEGVSFDSSVMGWPGLSGYTGYRNLTLWDDGFYYVVGADLVLYSKTTIQKEGWDNWDGVNTEIFPGDSLQDFNGPSYAFGSGMTNGFSYMSYRNETISYESSSLVSWVGAIYCYDHKLAKSPDGIIHAIARCDRQGGYYHSTFSISEGFGGRHFISDTTSMTEGTIEEDDGEIYFFAGCMYFTHRGINDSSVVEESCDGGNNWVEALALPNKRADRRVPNDIWIMPESNSLFRLESRGEGYVLVEYVFDAGAGVWSVNGIDRTEVFPLDFSIMGSELVSDFSGGKVIHFAYIDKFEQRAWYFNVPLIR